MKSLRTIRLTALLIGILGFIAGCVEPELMLRINPEETGPIRIGAIVPLSGDNRDYGTRMLRGIRLAVDELNAGRGINGRRIELLVYDNSSTREGAARMTRSAAAEGAVALIAGYNTTEVGGIVPLAEPLRLPVMIPQATANRYVGYSRFVFRCVYSDRQQAEALAGYLWYWRKLLRLGIVVNMDPDDEYSRNIARDVAQCFTDLGGEVVRTIEIRGENFDHELQELMTHGPQAILLPVEGKLAAKMLKALRDKGYGGIVCGPDTWDSEEFFQMLSDRSTVGDCVYIGMFGADDSYPAFRDFNKRFREHYFHTPGSTETLSYDAVKLLAVGLGHAETIMDFEKNWESIKKYPAASGVMSTLPKGGIDSTIYIDSISPGNYVAPHPHPQTIRSFTYSTLESYRND